jgi:hypothetical protein
MQTGYKHMPSVTRDLQKVPREYWIGTGLESPTMKMQPPRETRLAEMLCGGTVTDFRESEEFLSRMGEYEDNRSG